MRHYNDRSEFQVKLQVGIHCGPVAAGEWEQGRGRRDSRGREVGKKNLLLLLFTCCTYKPFTGIIGHKRYMFDVWGDTVNMASRMMSTSITNHIQISAAVHEQLHDDR